MLIRLTTLGAARVHRGDAAIADLPAQRLRFALLLYLAVERDVSREEVVAMFWPDRDTARGKHALRQMLYELRQVLGEDWIQVRRDRIVVAAAVDAAEFESAAEAGRAEAALALYGGPFLLGFSLDNRSFEAWADRRGAHLARVHRRLRRDNIARLVAAGRTDDAVVAARRWVELDPLDDEAAHTLIQRLAAAGQRTTALQYYDNYERQLAAELQVEPLDETQALVAAIRSGAALPQPDAIRPPIDADPPAAGNPDGSAAADADGSAAAVSDGSVPTVMQRSVAVAVLALLVLFGVVFYAGAGRSESTTAARRVSIAVLPLNDNSMDGTLLPLANVLTEDLARGLAQSRFLDVISPNGVRLMRSQGTPEDSLGRMLSADYLVGGSVSRYGESVRVDVELLDGRSGKVVRSEAFDRPWSQSRSLVDDVVRGAGVFLRREVGMRIEIERTEAGVGNEQAFRLMLEAEAIQEPIVTLLGAGQTSAALTLLARADSVLEIAATLDPDWVQPVVRRGWILERRAFIARIPGSAEVELRRELYEGALAMAARAAERDDDHAAVHALKGALLHQMAALDGQPEDSIMGVLAAAERELSRAAELDPLNQSVWRRLAELLASVGRYGEAKVAAEKGYRLDPYGPDVRPLTHLLFLTSFESGEDRDAHGWCSQGSADYEGDLVFLYCMLALHAWADAIEPQPDLLRAEMRSFQLGDRRIQPHLTPRFETMIAAAYARAGQPDTARAILDRVAGTSHDSGVLWMRASVHALLGEDSTALDLLEDYLEVGGWSAPRVALSRPFWHLRERTELQRLIDGRASERISRSH